MLLARSTQDLPDADRAVAIGTFDGVHRGHRKVIEAARANGLRSAVITFDPHPRAVLGGEVRAICSLERRLELLGELGVDDVLVVRFTKRYARIVPAQWIEQTLAPLRTRVVCVGEDFRFGRGRSGDCDLLRAHGLDVRPVGLIPGVSSSRVRELLAMGRHADAEAMLGHPLASSLGSAPDPYMRPGLAAWLCGQAPEVVGEALSFS